MDRIKGLSTGNYLPHKISGEIDSEKFLEKESGLFEECWKTNQCSSSFNIPFINELDYIQLVQKHVSTVQIYFSLASPAFPFKHFINQNLNIRKMLLKRISKAVHTPVLSGG